jgi:hypothetical protein
MRRPAGTIRAGIWLDGLGLAGLGVALSLLLAGLVTVPQRRAQRPGGAGVLALHLEADGGLRLWNRRLGDDELSTLLRQAARRPGPPPRLRLIPAAAVPWGAVRERLETLAARHGGLPVELQLP